jgi:hypothetical protein
MSDITIDRRKLLLGLAAASTAAATATAASAAVQEENAELLRLGDELPSVEDAYIAARNLSNASRDKYEPLWPKAPRSLNSGWPHDNWRYWTSEDSFIGWKTDRKIYTSYGLREGVEKLRQQQKYGRGDQAEIDRLEKLIPIAERYEAKCHRIRRESNYQALDSAAHAAAKNLVMLIGSIMACKDKTIEGLMIKAQALSAFDGMAPCDKSNAIFEPYDWAGQIADSIVRHAHNEAIAA